MKEEITEYWVNSDLFDKFEKLYFEHPEVRSVRKLSKLCSISDKTVQRYLRIKRWDENTQKPNLI